MKKVTIFLLTTLLLLTACTLPAGEASPSRPEKETISVTRYRMAGSSSRGFVEKYEIEGHEYIVFHGNIGNPPYALHSESCSCRHQ